MADPVKAAFDVAFEHPNRRVAFGQRTEALANGVGAGAAFPETVGVAVSDRLRNRLQGQRVERLHGAVTAWRECLKDAACRSSSECSVGARVAADNHDVSGPALLHTSADLSSILRYLHRGF